MDSPAAADWAVLPILLEVLTQARVAEPVAAGRRAACLLHDISADRAEELREGIPIIHHSPGRSSVLNTHRRGESIHGRD